VRAAGRLQTPEQFGDIVVRSSRDGSVVHLRDLSRIELGSLNYQQVGRVNGQPGVGIAVFQAPGSNALAVAQGVRSRDEPAALALSGGSRLHLHARHHAPVSEGIREILKTLAEAMVLVTIVVFLFLQNWRATLIPMLAVPVSLDRHVHRLPAARLLGQHAVALRPRARHRPRGRRCDRRGRGGGAPHRERDEPEGRHAQAMREVSGRSWRSRWCSPRSSSRSA
jgi:hypothetical protein